jgi:hypothetical protein
MQNEYVYDLSKKTFDIFNTHCSNGLFDQMWSSCEPYIVVLSWNWSFI